MAAPTLMGELMGKLGAGTVTLLGFLKGGPVGAFIANKGAAAINSLRAAGIKKTDDLVREAMLNPALARVLMLRVTQENASGIGAALVRALSGIAAQRGGHLAARVEAARQEHAQPSVPTNPLAILGAGAPATPNALAAAAR